MPINHSGPVGTVTNAAPANPEPPCVHDIDHARPRTSQGSPHQPQPQHLHHQPHHHHPGHATLPLPLQPPVLRYGASSGADAGPPVAAPSPSASQAAQLLGKTQTVFIHKLYDMLEDASLSHLIWWLPTNDLFCLYPGEEFSNVLAQYFKHTNIASFIRQLNMYGFHKVNDNFQSDDKLAAAAAPAVSVQLTKWEFRHAANQFRKGDIDSLSMIKRKLSKVTTPHKEIVSLKTLPPTSSGPVDEPKGQDPQHQLYHRAVYQQLWDQLSDASSVSPKISRPVAVPTVMAHHLYPVYPHPVAVMQQVPHSPGSPPFPDHPVGSPLYFHPQPQQPLQPQLRQPSVPTPTSAMDHSINLKLIGMNTTITTLKSNYAELCARYDALAALFRRNQADLLQLTEIVEKLNADKDPVKREEELVDRSRNKTPIDRVTTPSHDAGMSPMSVRPSSKQSDLASFKKDLTRRISNPVSANAHEQKPAPSQNYHLDDVSLTLSKMPNYYIVPQHYPLNPNYSLYNNSEFRPHLNEDQGVQHTANRHTSVLMDPLQPVPGRAAMGKAPTPIPTAVQDNKSSSPLSVVGKDREPGLAAPYVQQYQPMVQPPMHVYYQHIQQEAPGQLRTASLPILENVGQAHGLGVPQRHSTTTIPKSRLFLSHEAEQQASQLRAPSPTAGGVPRAAPMTPVSSVPPVNEQPKVAPVNEKEGAPVKQHLPSVLELNKLIMSGAPAPTSGRVFDLLLDNEGDDDRTKKRKIDG